MAQIDDLTRRLEVAETELKLVLEGSGGQKEVEELTEGGSGQMGERLPRSSRAETGQSGQRPGRKSLRGEFVM